MTDRDGFDDLQERGEALGDSLGDAATMAAAFDSQMKRIRAAFEETGKDVATLARTALPAIRRRIGVVFQDFRLLDHLTVAQNVALPLAVAGVPENTYTKNVAELLEWVGLGDKRDLHPEVLSGGQKQQVAIARAVVGNPSLVLADEPTGNVDAEIGERLMWLLAQLNRQGTTLVIATHDAALRARYEHLAGELHLDTQGCLIQRARQVSGSIAGAI